MKNRNYAYSSEDAYSRVLSLTHHIEKLQVCMHWRGLLPFKENVASFLKFPVV